MESYDPILNPVLNREVRKTGGRVLITLGDQDIDLSPSFTIFLSTRDPSVSSGGGGEGGASSQSSGGGGGGASSQLFFKSGEPVVSV